MKSSGNSFKKSEIVIAFKGELQYTLIIRNGRTEKASPEKTKKSACFPREKAVNSKN
jgi:hypothetical protein